MNVGQYKYFSGSLCIFKVAPVFKCVCLWSDLPCSSRRSAVHSDIQTLGHHIQDRLLPALHEYQGPASSPQL